MMKIPENCVACTIAKWEYDNCYCPILAETFYDTREVLKKRPEKCPLDLLVCLKDLDKFDINILQLALAQAHNMVLYGVDVSKKWDTAKEQLVALDKAYSKGLHDGIEKGQGK